MTNKNQIPKMIPEGRYRLKEDFVNPNVDRRKKSDWRFWPVWKAGTIFYAHDDYDNPMSLISIGNKTYPYIYKTPPGFIELLEPIPPENVRQAFRVAGESEGAILSAIDQLVAENKLTYKDLFDALDRRRNRT